MTFQLNIAGMLINIDSSDSFKINKELECFSTFSNQDADLNVIFESCLEISIPNSTLLLDERMKWFVSSDKEKNFSIFIHGRETNSAIYCLQVNNTWKEAVITYLKNDPDNIASFLGPIGEILFRNRILFHQGIVIHAAAIEWEGKGILFSAPSGTGKTTQANLWKRYRGAKILNADRPAIRVLDKEPYIYGTPWNGSSTKYKNHSVPLSAIIMLVQAKENSIRKLDRKEAISIMMPRCFLPYYDEDIMNLAIDNLENIIAATPVYLLQCRPDKEAMEMVYQCVR
jgi:hypothetical protein